MEVPLPGSDGLDFSRGVTDLDAVRKDGASHADSKVGRGARSRQGDRVPGLLIYPVYPETQPASGCHPALSARWLAASSSGAESAPSGGPSMPVLCLSSWRPCPGVEWPPSGAPRQPEGQQQGSGAAAPAVTSLLRAVLVEVAACQGRREGTGSAFHRQGGPPSPRLHQCQLPTSVPGGCCCEQAGLQQPRGHALDTSRPWAPAQGRSRGKGRCLHPSVPRWVVGAVLHRNRSPHVRKLKELSHVAQSEVGQVRGRVISGPITAEPVLSVRAGLPACSPARRRTSCPGRPLHPGHAPEPLVMGETRQVPPHSTESEAP